MDDAICGHRLVTPEVTLEVAIGVILEVTLLVTLRVTRVERLIADFR